MKEIVFLYDGSFEGFLTVAFFSFKRKIFPKKIIREKDYIINLFEEQEFINTDFNLSDRVLSGIKNVSEKALYNIYYSFLCHNENKELILLDFIINLFKYGKNILYMRNISSTLNVEKMMKRVKREAHKFKGFIRFSKMQNNIYYAKIDPECDVLEIVSNHFKNRLRNEIWIIEDTKHNKASFFNKKEFVIVNKTSHIYEKLIKPKEEKEFEDLWKCFFENVNIKERKNLRCQRNFMPKKYWKNILEVSK